MVEGWFMSSYLKSHNRIEWGHEELKDLDEHILLLRAVYEVLQMKRKKKRWCTSSPGWYQTVAVYFEKCLGAAHS